MRRSLIRLLAAVGIFAGCAGEPERAAPESRPAVEVTTEVAAVTAVADELVASGGIEPWARVSPGSKILGRVSRVAVREGDLVEHGALLVRLESRDLEAAVQQARAAVSMAEARLVNARAQKERMVVLHGRGSVTDKGLEDATAGFRVAEAGLEQARANLTAAEVALGYAEIRSPVAGWVISRRVEPGDMATPGQPLLTLEDLSRVKVSVEVPEAAVTGLARGSRAQVILDALGKTLDAEIDSIIPSGDSATRTFAVKLILDNPSGRLKSGMFARVAFSRGRLRPSLLVPSAAVVGRGQLDGLFVVEGEGAAESRARLRWVKTGRRHGDRVEILSGLEPGERYVHPLTPGLEDGVPVKAAATAEREG